MKKLKIILFIITILLCGVFLFATCKKTNALEESGLYNNSYVLDGLDSNSSMVCIYENIPNNELITYARINYTTGFVVIRKTTDNYINIISSEITTSFNFSLPSDALYLYIIFGRNDYSCAILVGYVTYQTSNNTFVNNYSIYDFSNMGQPGDQLVYDYFAGGNDISIIPLFQNNLVVTSAGYKGLVNYFIYDCLDYSITMTEQFNDIYDEYIYPNISYNQYNRLYQAGYTSGYNFGYQLGYDDGYADGETAGYNSGYNTGYNAGLADNTTAYNHGYDDGYADGYRYGVVYGYDDGYETGYNVGFTEGQAGATPVSKTIGIISSIFAGIGEVLAVELFPGFTIGILILVPLFFGVLGLILWIWRRN